MKQSRDIQGRHAARFFTNSRIFVFSAKRLSECSSSTGALLAPTFRPSPDICHAVLPSKFGGERKYAETENLNRNSQFRQPENLTGPWSARNRCSRLAGCIETAPHHTNSPDNGTGVLAASRAQRCTHRSLCCAMGCAYLWSNLLAGAPGARETRTPCIGQ